MMMRNTVTNDYIGLMQNLSPDKVWFTSDTHFFHSHVIDKQRLSVLLPSQYDVGVDNNNFTPISFREIQKRMEMNL